MSLVTTTLKIGARISVTLRIGGQADTIVTSDRLSVLIAARQTVVGPPGVAGLARTYTIVSAPVVTPNVDNYDVVAVTAQAEPLMLANPVHLLNVFDRKKLMIVLQDNGFAQPISYGAQYRGLTAPLPLTTTPGKTMYLGFIQNPLDAKWDLLAFANEI